MVLNNWKRDKNKNKYIEYIQEKLIIFFKFKISVTLGIFGLKP